MIAKLKLKKHSSDEDESLLDRFDQSSKRYYNDLIQLQKPLPGHFRRILCQIGTQLHLWHDHGIFSVKMEMIKVKFINFKIIQNRYRISLNNVPPWIMSPLEQCPPLNSVPFYEKAQYIKKEHYSNVCTFEIAILGNVPRHYLRKYGKLQPFRTIVVILVNF